MQTRHIQHTFNGKVIVALNDQNVLINNADDFLELIMNLPAERILLHSENMDTSFFDLRTGLAGEIFQKAVDYSRSLGIVGDHSRVSSRSLRDFFSKSSQSNNIIFVDSLDEGLRKLSA